MMNLEKYPPTLAHAIKELNSEAEFCVRNEDIDDIEWTNNTTPISKDNIQAKLDELMAEYNSFDYARKRQAEYPTIEELVVALYDTDDKSAIEAKRAEVKNKFPKT